MRWRIAVGLLLLGVAVAIVGSGAYQELAPERLRETVLSLGPLGALSFVIAFAVLEPFYVPGLVFLLTAPMIWPLPQAFLLSLAGGTGAGLVALGIARFLARDWVQARLPQSWRAWDDRLASHGFRTVTLIRLLSFLAPAAHWVIGLSSVRVVPAVAGTVVGLAPGVLLFTWLGARITDGLARVPRPVWLALAALGLGVFWAYRARRARAAGAGPAPAASGAPVPGPPAPD